MSLTMPVAIHLYSALAAFVLGGLILSRRVKGDGLHRTLGWTWVGLMLSVAASSLWIPGFLRFSWIHALTALTFVGLWQGVGHARARRVAAHRGSMKGLYVGGLLVAGALAFMPGRALHGAVLALLR